MTSLVVTSWMAVFGTSVDSRAAEMTLEIAINDSVDSLPPVRYLNHVFGTCEARQTF
jgi:hypothetical protein